MACFRMVNAILECSLETWQHGLWNLPTEIWTKQTEILTFIWNVIIPRECVCLGGGESKWERGWCSILLTVELKEKRVGAHLSFALMNRWGPRMTETWLKGSNKARSASPGSRTLGSSRSNPWEKALKAVWLIWKMIPSSTCRWMGQERARKAAYKKCLLKPLPTVGNWSRLKPPGKL